MATAGKVRSLVTRPYQSTDLAFEIPGILDWQSSNFKVGQRILPAHIVDPDQVATSFNQRAADSLHTVVFNSARMKTDLNAKAIFRLRNYQEIVALEQTIAQRDLQYVRIYKNAGVVAQTLRNAAAEQLAHSRGAKAANRERHDAINAAYDAETDPTWRGVKKATQTVHTSKGEVMNDLFVAPVGMTTPQYQIKAESAGNASTQTLTDSLAIPVYNEPSDSDPVRSWRRLDARAAAGSRGRVPDFFSQRTIVQEDKNVRVSMNHGNEFWHPKLENKIEFDRLQGVVIQEEVRSALNSLSVDSIDDILKRELDLIELEVLKSQTRLLNTYLTPTFQGLITAIYKDVGEYVQAGEPVVRVENDSRVFLYGFVQLRAAPQIGQNVTLRSKIFETVTERTYQATIVSVRGHNTDDDEWELLLERSNPTGADYLPLNFGFDPGTTSISFA